MISSNEFHTYFRVNSIFWDPNIYGRYLALVIVVAMSALLWARERREPGAAARPRRGPLAGPGPDLLAVELRRPARRPGGARRAALERALDAAPRSRSARSRALIVVIFVGGSSKLNPDRLNVDTGGRATWSPAAPNSSRDRPVWGYGAGSLPGRLPRTHRDQEGPGLRLPHRAGHGRRRAGPDRPRRLRRPDRRAPSGPWALGPVRLSRGHSRDAADRRPRDRPRAAVLADLRRPARPHDGLRRLLRGPDHLGPAGGRAPRWRASAVREPA